MKREMIKRIENLNTNLVLQETRILLVINEVKKYAIKIDKTSVSKFRELLNELQHLKNEYNCIKTQLRTLTVYQTRQ